MEKIKAADGGRPSYLDIETPEGYISYYEECCPGMPIEVARKLFEDARPKVIGADFKGIIITGTKGNDHGNRKYNLTDNC